MGCDEMTPEKWNLVKDIFSEAVELLPHERSAFIQGRSRGDETVVGEVNALLQSDEEVDAFIEERALSDRSRGRPRRNGCSLQSDSGGRAFRKTSCDQAHQARFRYRRYRQTLQTQATDPGGARSSKHNASARRWCDRRRTSVSRHGLRRRIAAREVLREHPPSSQRPAPAFSGCLFGRDLRASEPYRAPRHQAVEHSRDGKRNPEASRL